MILNSMTKRLSILLLLAISLSGCLYKMDIYQGNVLDQEQIDKLQLGMDKNRVIAILGSPQLTDPFHSQRWDYYAMSNLDNQKKKTVTLLTLLFEDNRVVEILAAETEDAPEKEEKEY
jgi:outer membrane protein assembly factor BamE